MSVIKTERGWVELGAAHPLEQAYETAGHRMSGAAVPTVPMVNRQRVMPPREMVAYGWTPEQVRRWNVRLAQMSGVNFCIQPCDNGFRDGYQAEPPHDYHRLDLRTLPAGVVLFGKYGPEWVI